MPKRIGILMGGLSSERDLSLLSGEAVYEALKSAGHDVVRVFVDAELDVALRAERIDVAFLAVHGRYGEDGCVQGLLELLGIPYTGPSLLGAALATDKVKTKELLRLHNLPTPSSYVHRAGLGTAAEQHGNFGFPVVVKPRAEGSSLGVERARDLEELEGAIDAAARFDEHVLVERCVRGCEVHVALLGEHALGLAEVEPGGAIFDFAARRGHATYGVFTPPRLTIERQRGIVALAERAARALECSGLVEVDVIVSEVGNEQIIEIDALPALRPDSMVGRIARAAGHDFTALCEQVLAGARLHAPDRRRGALCDRRRPLSLGMPDDGVDRRAVGQPHSIAAVARDRGLILGAVVLGALGIGALADRTAHQLPIATRAAIARGLGVEPAAVSFRRLTLGVHGLSIEALAAGPLFVRSARFQPTLDALFGGTGGELLLEGVRLEDPPRLEGVVDRVEIERAEIALRGARSRVHLHAATFVPSSGATPRVRVAELGVELDRRLGKTELQRLAFTGVSIGPLSGLAGGGRVEAGVLEVRAAAPGISAALDLRDSPSARLVFRHAHVRWDPALAPILARAGIAAGEVILDGQLDGHRAPDGTASAHVELDVESGSFVVPRLSPVPVAVTALSLEGGVDFDGDHAHAKGKLREGAIELGVEGDLTGPTTDAEAAPTLAIDLSLASARCADVLSSFPPAFRRALDGMSLDGELSATLSLTLPRLAPEDLALDASLALGCRVLSEPPLADARALRSGSPCLGEAVDASGAPRTFLVGPANPDFRRLEQIPRVVSDTIVEAEDGRFWKHHGVDLDSMRRALAYDLGTGEPGRGGSTITQQVAKNLFLSGERTLGRKLEEAVLAWRLESVLDKRRILELYLNLVELGPGVYGVQEGARRWFGKDVSALGAEEAASLAALLPAPRRGMDDAFRARLAQLKARLK